MGAKQNVIVAGLRETLDLADLLGRIGSLARELIGELHLVSVQNFETGSIDDRALEGPIGGEVPRLGDNQIVFFYPKEMSRGSVSLTHEGWFDIVTISLATPLPVLELISRVWDEVGQHDVSVLAGEECEIEASALHELLAGGGLLEACHTCEAAIVKQDGASDYRWGGRLITAG